MCNRTLWSLLHSQILPETEYSKTVNIKALFLELIGSSSNISTLSSKRVKVSGSSLVNVVIYKNHKPHPVFFNMDGISSVSMSPLPFFFQGTASSGTTIFLLALFFTILLSPEVARLRHSQNCVSSL